MRDQQEHQNQHCKKSCQFYHLKYFSPVSPGLLFFLLQRLLVRVNLIRSIDNCLCDQSRIPQIFHYLALCPALSGFLYNIIFIIAQSAAPLNMSLCPCFSLHHLTSSSVPLVKSSHGTINRKSPAAPHSMAYLG